MLFDYGRCNVKSVHAAISLRVHLLSIPSPYPVLFNCAIAFVGLTHFSLMVGPTALIREAEIGWMALGL